ncbi:MAG: hypothetical protein ABI627_11810 [Polyangiaceae bacterium]
MREADANAQRAATLRHAEDAWEIVLLFYSSLHMVEAYLRTKAPRFHAEDHVGIGKAIAASPEIKHMAGTYKALRELSQQVRYDPGFSVTDQHKANARKHTVTVDSAIRGKVAKWLAAQPL